MFSPRLVDVVRGQLCAQPSPRFVIPHQAALASGIWDGWGPGGPRQIVLRRLRRRMRRARARWDESDGWMDEYVGWNEHERAGRRDVLLGISIPPVIRSVARGACRAPRYKEG